MVQACEEKNLVLGHRRGSPVSGVGGGRAQCTLREGSPGSHPITGTCILVLQKSVPTDRQGSTGWLHL